MIRKSENTGWKVAFTVFFIFSCLVGVAIARSAAPPTARTGDFGELNCTACHQTNPLNVEGGSIVITGVPTEYQPGATYAIQVKVTRAGQLRWGFELAARAVSTQQQAGTLATTDANTQIQVANGIQYIGHTSAGTYAGTTAGGTWNFNWTAPNPAVGAIRFGAAGNAANNNGANTGDYIYTTTATTNPVAAAKPVTALFSHVAVGAGFTTVFTLVNTGADPVDGSLILTKSDGQPLDATISSATAAVEAAQAGERVYASSALLSIPAGGTSFVAVNPLSAGDALKTGWARVESTGGSLSGVGTFQYTVGGKLSSIAGVLASSKVKVATIPVDDDSSQSRYTGYAVGNPGTDDINLKLVLVNKDGSIAQTLTPARFNPLKAGTQVPGFLFEDLNNPSLKFQGSVVLIAQAAKEFSVVALVQNAGLYTAIPIIPTKAASIPD